ncbi:MAG TPA: sigma-70 family RNA polymerase sigma factor [Clostridiales bacterium]|jgi:RNA polymerase sigma-70 factor (ECF subfamily)|nr:sigma-70 family RNA polymerase sigma factor [Clostridiales bacterium]
MVVRVIQKTMFLDLIKQYERLIFTICFSFTKNEFDAEDLAQETFLSAYKNISKFDGKNPKAWLTTIAANKCRDHLKSPAAKTGNLSEAQLDFMIDTDDSPEYTLIKDETNQRVWDICLKLKEPYKTVSVNYFCKNLKLSEVARDTGQNLKTLQTQLTRSKKLLKALWKEEGL